MVVVVGLPPLLGLGTCTVHPHAGPGWGGRAVLLECRHRSCKLSPTSGSQTHGWFPYTTTKGPPGTMVVPVPIVATKATLPWGQAKCCPHHTRLLRSLLGLVEEEWILSQHLRSKANSSIRQ